MSLNDAIFAACRRLREEASRENNPQVLHQLVLEINSLLNVIEKRLAELEGYRDQPGN